MDKFTCKLQFLRVATEMFFIYYNLIHHNMFRPLWAILKWGIHQSFFYGAINSATNLLYL
jgi:hypothetical protein